MDLKSVAVKFAEFLYPSINKLDIDEIVLYGSIAKGSSSPNDIDIMFLHRNPVLEKMQQIRGNDNCANDFERYSLLIRELTQAGYPLITGLLNIKECTEAIRQGKLNTIYLHQKFFTCQEYRNTAISSNKDPKFFEDVFKTALIWNNASRDFDIPLSSKYALPLEERILEPVSIKAA